MNRWVILACALIAASGVASAQDASSSGNSGGGGDSGGCNQDVWRYVHDASRLQVQEPCKIVSGRVASAETRLDGDYHINLMLDPEYPGLLNDGNIKQMKGALVVEIACQHSFKWMKGACDGIPYRFQIPHKGDRIRVWGSYVLDAGHGWMEIHPVMRLEILPKDS